MQTTLNNEQEAEADLLYGLCRQAWLSDNEFIADNNLAYVKPAVIRDKKNIIYAVKTLYTSI